MGIPFQLQLCEYKNRKYLYLLLMLGIIRLTTRLPRASLFQIKKNLEQHSNLALNAVLVRKLSSIMSMLQPATPAPEFGGKAVVDGQIKDIKLADYQGKYVVLLFYPADFTFVCPTEIIAFSERAAEFRKENCEVNGVSKADSGVAFRGLFIIDGGGMLRQITVNDLPVGRDVDETLRLVQAFKFTDEHGEVCPAGWRKGKKTMKPTKEGVSQYLATQMKNGMEH